MDSKNNMTRREAIKRTGMLMGGVVFAPSILGVLKGCTATPGVDWTPTLFSSDQARLVSALADVILPEDDTPSASQAGVPAFIESMVQNVYNEEQRNNFLEGLDGFGVDSSSELEGNFYDLTDEVKFDYTYGINQAVVEDRSRNRGGETPFIMVFRELTMLGYFTSEVGATQVLRYSPVPGRYDGCVPFEEIGRTWAT
ncbi:MAG: gluconate 2-dehydrogenase subunit 3 family protein [Balneolaceae bacterium]